MILDEPRGKDKEYVILPISSSLNKKYYHECFDILLCKNDYPKLDGVMLGRGLLSRPSLAYEYKKGIELSQSQIIKELICLHNKLFQYFSSKLQGESHLLTKMKTYWDFSEPIVGHKLYKQIKKTTTVSKYNSIVNAIEKLT